MIATAPIQAFPKVYFNAILNILVVNEIPFENIIVHSVTNDKSSD